MSAPAAEGLQLRAFRTNERPPVGRSRRPVRNGRAAGLLVLLAVLAWSAYGCGVGRGPLLNAGGWPVAQKFLAAALHPERSGEFLRLVGTSTLITIAYAVLGAAMALVVGAVGCIFVSATFWRTASHRSGALAWAGIRGGLALPRGLHEAVWAILLVNVLGLDPLVAILAIGIPYGAVTAKVWADLLDEVPHGPYEALRLAGAGRLPATLYGLLPQARGDLLSYSFYRLECALRSAVLLGIVGAGGLGFQLDLSFQALRYREMWTVLYAVVLLCAVTDAVGTRIRNRLSERVPVPVRHGLGQSRLRHPRHDPVLLGAVVLTTVLLGWAWHFLRVRPATLASERAGQQASLVLADAWPPRRDGHTLSTLVRLSLETVQMSVVAIALAATGGALLALLAARARRAGAPRRVAGAAVRLLLLLARAVPPPVWALILLFVTYPGPLPGALALAAYNLGILGRLMAEGVENLDPAPTEALTTAGAPGASAWLYGTAPRISPRFLVFSLYRWEVALRETVVVGIVGAGGLGDLLAKQISAFDWSGVSSTIGALIVLTFLVDLVSVAARSRLR